MNSTSVKAKLIGILEAIQSDGGYAAMPINGTTRPLNDLEGFDTKLSPIAISQLAMATGIDIPSSKNVFVSADGRRLLSVDEIVVEVCKFAYAVV